MIKLRTYSSRILLIFALLLPWMATEAIETFERAGKIENIGIGSFTIDNQKYTLTPAARINVPDTVNAKLSDLKPGDSVFFKGNILGSVYYVEFVTYIPVKNK